MRTRRRLPCSTPLDSRTRQTDLCATSLPLRPTSPALSFIRPVQHPTQPSSATFSSPPFQRQLKKSTRAPSLVQNLETPSNHSSPTSRDRPKKVKRKTTVQRPSSRTPSTKPSALRATPTQRSWRPTTPHHPRSDPLHTRASAPPLPAALAAAAQPPRPPPAPRRKP